jgi:hypothetical protein
MIGWLKEVLAVSHSGWPLLPNLFPILNLDCAAKRAIVFSGRNPV